MQESRCSSELCAGPGVVWNYLTLDFLSGLGAKHAVSMCSSFSGRIETPSKTRRVERHLGERRVFDLVFRRVESTADLPPTVGDTR